MLTWLPAFLKAPLLLALLSLNVAFGGLTVTLCGLLKLLSPSKRLRDFWTACAHSFYRGWSKRNKVFIELFNRVEWEISGAESLRQDSWYLLIANHQSWLDIPVLTHFALNKIPEPKFFLKEQLKWVPFLGTGCWALHMPFMKRYSQAQIRKNPALKGKDIETTRHSCEKFKDHPTTIINFVEGSRFTKAKHRAKKSTFQHLLPPKAGGIAFTLASMGQQFDAVIDVTVIYPDNRGRVIIDLLLGRLKRVIVSVQVLPIDENIIGDYFNDEPFRIKFQEWLNQRWELKDRVLAAYLPSKSNTANPKNVE